MRLKQLRLLPLGLLPSVVSRTDALAVVDCLPYSLPICRRLSTNNRSVSGHLPVAVVSALCHRDKIETGQSKLPALRLTVEYYS